MQRIIISIGIVLCCLQPGNTQDKNFVFIDLTSVVNRGFYDEVAGDSIGGWTDFGPSACFYDLGYGIQTFQDGIIPFKIIDPGKNDGKSVIVLNGPGRENVFPEKSTDWEKRE